MKNLRLVMNPMIGPPVMPSFRKVANWLTCRITDRPILGRVIRASRILDRYRSVTSAAACLRDWDAMPVMIPVVRNNRKSGLGTPVSFRNNPFFPAPAEKNAIGRIREALAICNTCPKLDECRSVTSDLSPTSPGFVQGGMVFVEKITDFKALITKWNASHPRSLRIPVKGSGAWTLCKIPTPKQYEEAICNLVGTDNFRGATLQMAIDSYEDTAREVDEFDPFDWADDPTEWNNAVEKHG